VTTAFNALKDILDFGAVDILGFGLTLTSGCDGFFWVIDFPQNAQKTTLSLFCLPHWGQNMIFRQYFISGANKNKLCYSAKVGAWHVDGWCYWTHRKVALSWRTVVDETWSTNPAIFISSFLKELCLLWNIHKLLYWKNPLRARSY